MEKYKKFIGKKIQRERMENLKCSCGCIFFTVPRMTIRLTDVPCEIGAWEGPQYDDSQARQSEGWDFIEEGEIVCQSCGRTCKIAQTRTGRFCFL